MQLSPPFRADWPPSASCPRSRMPTPTPTPMPNPDFRVCPGGRSPQNQIKFIAMSAAFDFEKFRLSVSCSPRILTPSSLVLTQIPNWCHEARATECSQDSGLSPWKETASAETGQRALLGRMVTCWYWTRMDFRCHISTCNHARTFLDMEQNSLFPFKAMIRQLCTNRIIILYPRPIYTNMKAANPRKRPYPFRLATSPRLMQGHLDIRFLVLTHSNYHYSIRPGSNPQRRVR